MDGQPEKMNHELWSRTRMELVTDGAKVEWERKLPDDVRDYLLKRLKEPEHGRSNKRARDSFLVYVIKDLRDTYNLPPTRNRNRHGSREDLSGCAIVAMVLAEFDRNLDESTVERIWDARNY
jgi:hypothetical protein